MKNFYKRYNNGFLVFEGEVAPDSSYTEFNDDSVLTELEQIESSREYLNSTDWYYARKMETGEEVPSEVTSKRIEARNFLRSKGC